MTNQVHGHEVIEMMLSSQEVYSRDSLKAVIMEKFGADTRFCTCSDENLDAAGLIEFLAERGKLIESPAGLSIRPDQVCDH